MSHLPQRSPPVAIDFTTLHNIKWRTMCYFYSFTKWSCCWCHRNFRRCSSIHESFSAQLNLSLHCIDLLRLFARTANYILIYMCINDPLRLSIHQANSCFSFYRICYNLISFRKIIWFTLKLKALWHILIPHNHDEACFFSAALFSSVNGAQTEEKILWFE